VQKLIRKFLEIFKFPKKHLEYQNVHVVFGSLVRLYKPHALDLTIANAWVRSSS